MECARAQHVHYAPHQVHKCCSSKVPFSIGNDTMVQLNERGNLRPNFIQWPFIRQTVGSPIAPLGGGPKGPPPVVFRK